MSGPTVTVSNSAELRSAFMAARGGETILLENAGETYRLSTNAPYDYDNRPLSAVVTIRSADPADPAVFDQVTLRGANNLEFRDLVFGGVGAPRRVVEVSGDVQDVSFIDNEFRGWAKGRWVDAASKGGAAMAARDVDGFRFIGNDVHNFGMGLDVIRGSNIQVEDNAFHHMQSDGLRMAQIENGRVAGNIMSDWFGVKSSIAHPDFIQLWSTNTTEPTRNLTIERNLLLANTEVSNQAIFLHNEAGLVYEDIAVRDNLVYASHWNAIWVHTTDGLEVSGNLLVRAHDAAGSANEAPAIRIWNSTDVRLDDNAASGFPTKTPWTGAGNVALVYDDVRSARFADAHLAEVSEKWGDDPLFAKFLEAVGMAHPDAPEQSAFGGVTPLLRDRLSLAATSYDEGLRGAAYMDAPDIQAGGAGGREGDVEHQDGHVTSALPGEWLEYTIHVERAGVYDLTAMLAANGGGRAVRIDAFLAGEDAPYATTGDVKVASTGSLKTFGGVSSEDLALEAGDQSLRVTFLGGAQAFQELTLERDADRVIGEVGTVTVVQADAAQWHRVSFGNILDDPSVVMGPLSLAGGDPTTLRVRNVTSEGFEFQVDEWDYLDGGHVAEAVSWMAVERGRHVLSDGSIVEAGDVRADHDVASAHFESAFADAPLVFAQVASVNGGAAVTTRLDDVEAGGFSIRLQEEELADQRHAVEDVDWIAFDLAAGSSLRGGRTGDAVRDAGATIEFENDGRVPHFFAGMESLNGGDAATVRLSELNAGDARILIDEETSRDRETTHTAESVAWLALSDELFLV